MQRRCTVDGPCRGMPKHPFVVHCDSGTCVALVGRFEPRLRKLTRRGNCWSEASAGSDGPRCSTRSWETERPIAAVPCCDRDASLGLAGAPPVHVYSARVPMCAMCRSLR
eukprot:scaffold3158_cov389-Prasinococcus_capsulatus_cf.AAC.20